MTHSIDRDDACMAEDAREALVHIINVVRGSRTQTRRLRWIESRAQSGLDGTTDWQKKDLPKTVDSAYEERRKYVKDRENMTSENEELKDQLEAANAEILALKKELENRPKYVEVEQACVGCQLDMHLRGETDDDCEECSGKGTYIERVEI